MAQQSQVRNPFMLMLQPEVVLAAIQNSERLERLNRHLCRPLDQQQIAFASRQAAVDAMADSDTLDELDALEGFDDRN
jgi:hypothetical protein